MTLVAVADTETTGLKVEKGERVIEIAIILYELETEKKIGQFVKRFNPEFRIDPKAQLIHKISQKDLIECEKFKESEPIITKIFSKSEIAVFHNAAFDCDFLINEYRLCNVNIPDIEVFDTMAEGRWATSNGKNPTLEELCYACEVEYDRGKAHAALYDVEKTAECFFFGLKHNGYSISGRIK